MNTKTNKQKALAFYEASDKLDYDAWRGAMTPDVIVHTNGGDAMSREQFEAMHRGLMDAFANGRHIIDSQVAEGDWVATRLTWTALHVGDFNGVPASNRPVRIAGAGYDRFENGKIVEHQAHFDAMGLMIQIGAIPAAA